MILRQSSIIVAAARIIVLMIQLIMNSFENVKIALYPY